MNNQENKQINKEIQGSFSILVTEYTILEWQHNFTFEITAKSSWRFPKVTQVKCVLSFELHSFQKLLMQFYIYTGTRIFWYLVSLTYIFSIQCKYYNAVFLVSSLIKLCVCVCVCVCVCMYMYTHTHKWNKR